MTGIIDKKGTQWEYCNCCGSYVKLQDLHYGVPNQMAAKYWKDKFPERTWLQTGEKLDLCSQCV